MIGIVTPYKTLNYGTKLQAYAMQEIISCFDKCEIVNYNTSRDLRISSVMGKLSINNVKSKLDNFAKKAKNKHDDEYNNVIRVRNKAIASFDSNYNFSTYLKNKKDFDKYIKKYDTVICGSDQLWSPANVINDWFTLSIFPKNIKKISYAASFGINDIPKKYESKYRKFLSSFDSIAVREKSGVDIVQKILNKSVCQTLDPTLAVDKYVWENLSRKSNIKIDKPYIFCYFLGENEEHRKYAYNLAQKTNCELVTLPFIKGNNTADKKYGSIKLDDVTPEDFISLIKHAKYVCTDSFHGTAFSIIFHKQFAVFERFSNDNENSTNSRIYSILELLGIESQLIKDGKSVEKFIKNMIEYEVVDKKLKNERIKAWEYLENSIGKKVKNS